MANSLQLLADYEPNELRLLLYLGISITDSTIFEMINGKNIVLPMDKIKLFQVKFVNDCAAAAGIATGTQV